MRHGRDESHSVSLMAWCLCFVRPCLSERFSILVLYANSWLSRARSLYTNSTRNLAPEDIRGCSLLESRLIARIQGWFVLRFTVCFLCRCLVSSLGYGRSCAHRQKVFSSIREDIPFSGHGPCSQLSCSTSSPLAPRTRQLASLVLDGAPPTVYISAATPPILRCAIPLHRPPGEDPGDQELRRHRDQAVHRPQHSRAFDGEASRGGPARGSRDQGHLPVHLIE